MSKVKRKKIWRYVFFFVSLQRILDYYPKVNRENNKT